MFRSQFIPGIAFGILAAAVFSLAINVPTITHILRGDLTVHHLQAGGIDEWYYFAMIRDASGDPPSFGHVSLKEHADEIAASTYGPAVQGFLMRAFDLELPAIIALGDIFLTFLIALAIFFVFRGIARRDHLAALGMIAYMSFEGAGWLRSINPQLSFLLFATYLAILLSPSSFLRRSLMLRGILLGILVPVQVLYAQLGLIMEGCVHLLRVLRARPGARDFLWNASFVFIPFVLLALPRVLSLVSHGGDVADDTQRRLGLLDSHLPAAPALQIALICTFLVVFLIRRRAHAPRLMSDLTLTMIIACLLGLNQSVVHGVDAIFGLYFYRASVLVMFLAAFVLLAILLRPRMATCVASFLALGFFLSSFHGNLAQTSVRAGEIQTYAQSDEFAVIEWLRTQTGGLIVAAPLPIADLLPVETDYFVLFSSYARYQRAADDELADRYLLMHTLFGTQEPEDDTYPSVFGLYAGNKAARMRTSCRLFSAFTKSDDECRVAIRDVIRHQDVLARLDAKQVDVRDAFIRFHVDTLITNNTFPATLADVCEAGEQIGSFKIYHCDLSEG